MWLLFHTGLFLGSVCFGLSAKELLHNGDMESTNGWTCSGCSMTLVTDHFSGLHSIKVTNRQNDFSSLRQSVVVKQAHTYIARCYFKLLNMRQGHSHTSVTFKAALHSSGHSHYKVLSMMKLQQREFGWTEIGGDFKIDSDSLTGNSAEIYLQMDPSLDFLIDHCSVTELIPDANWKSKAQTRIEQSRKADITINLAGPVDNHGYFVELVQERRSFAWGTAVKVSHITDNFTDFQNFLYNNFEWAVPANAMKWKLMEFKKGKERYDWLSALDMLLSKGLKVRGHNMFWGVVQHAPSWLTGLSQSQVVTEMKRHVSSMISHTKGKLQHWDVNNENLHGDYYELHTGNVNITNDMFTWIHNLEPNVKLFLNDFNVISSSQMTTALKEQALHLKSAGVPIYGIGIQAHFHSSNIDIDAVKYRLDKVAEAGLPIWITEFTITDSNDTSQASAYEDLLTLFYSHPAIEGVIIWNFWDGAIFDPRAAITTGPKVTLRESGRVYQRLVNQAWKTHVRRQVTTHQPIHTRVTKGDYLLTTRHYGKVLHQQRISVGSAGKVLTVHLQDNTHVSHIAFG